MMSRLAFIIKSIELRVLLAHILNMAGVNHKN